MKRSAILLALVASFTALDSRSATPPPEMQKRVRAATFEVVVPKPADTGITYERPLPLELLPFSERNDHYWSLGTAFAMRRTPLSPRLTCFRHPSMGSAGPPRCARRMARFTDRPGSQVLDAAGFRGVHLGAPSRWTRSDPAYHKLTYPGGDVPIERGVCTDVMVRALRVARALDLQKLLHEDIKANWDAYPHQRRWDLDKPDPNIDHRRVPNLMTYSSGVRATP